MLQYRAVRSRRLRRHHRGAVVRAGNGDAQFRRARVAVCVLHGVVQVVAQVARRGQRLGGRTAVVQHVAPAAVRVQRQAAVGVQRGDVRRVARRPGGERRRRIRARRVVAQHVAADAAGAVFGHAHRAVVCRQRRVVRYHNSNRSRRRAYRAIRGGQCEDVGLQRLALVHVRGPRSQLISVSRLARGGVVTGHG